MLFRVVCDVSVCDGFFYFVWFVSSWSTLGSSVFCGLCRLDRLFFSVLIIYALGNAGLLPATFPSNPQGPLGTLTAAEWSTSSQYWRWGLSDHAVPELTSRMTNLS